MIIYLLKSKSIFIMESAHLYLLSNELTLKIQKVGVRFKGILVGRKR